MKSPVFFSLQMSHWRKWRKAAGWLLGSVTVLLSLIACTAQTTPQLSPSPQPSTPDPLSLQPLSTLDFSAFSTPTLVPVTPEGVVTEIGYNVKGWF